MSQNTIILFLQNSRVPQNAEKRIAEAAGGRAVVITESKAEVEKILGAVEIAAGDFPHEFIQRVPVLGWFHQWYAGADWLQRYPEARKLPFLLTNSSGIHGSQMTEHLFGLLIAWYRKFPDVFAAQKRREWARKIILNKTDLLAGKSLLILGFGTIGAQVARVAAAFDMSVTGIRRTPGAAPAGVEKVLTYEYLHEALPGADIVVNILPHTPETKELMGAKEFAAMKKTALFANIGRGSTVNEDALAEAVRGGIIGGAILDVTAREPLPPESPLWDIPGIIITPHYSGFHPRYDEIAFDLFLDNLKRYTAGEPLLNVVDKERGY
jgi:phosphoglycerate dehydrogenase-like enzyme